MSEAVKIAIVLNGGCLSAVLSAGVPVEYVLIDYDTEGQNEDDLYQIPQPGSKYGPADALAMIEGAEVDGPRVMELFDIVRRG